LAGGADRAFHLKKEGLWDEDMMKQLKYFDGELKDIDNIPQHIKDKHLTVFSVDYRFILDAAARRQKWIDQSQSVNLFLSSPDLKVLSHMYRRAWQVGLKTTYYLRTLQASNVEKISVNNRKEITGVVARDTTESAPRKEFSAEEKLACSIEAMRNGEECEACQ